ncbi:MAG TPA: hypothetical protein VFQ22_12325 [Longimicrobiales bacterium]|nr:hypothetical protein [Longimicrobiales bacterium]
MAGSGRIVAVVASQGAVASGWAPAAALDLARVWSGAGEKVILADGGLHYPSLHTLAAVQNDEGLSDAALFGVSIGRVAKPVDGGAFFLIPAGTAVADANSVPGSRRWGRLLEGCQEAGVKLLVYLRDGDSGCAAFLGSASDIVILSDRGEGTPGAVRDLEGMVRAVLGPRAGTPRPGGSPAAPPAAWTAKSPSGQRRIWVLAVVVIALVAFLVAFFLFFDYSSLLSQAQGGPHMPLSHAGAGPA